MRETHRPESRYFRGKRKVRGGRVLGTLSLVVWVLVGENNLVPSRLYLRCFRYNVFQKFITG